MRFGAALIRCGVVAFALMRATSAFGQAETALDRYIAAPDPNYRYELLSTIAGDGYTAYVLEMTSQEWRGAEEVDRPIWKHWVTIVRPDHVVTSTGLLVVSGGSNESEPPLQVNPLFSQLALTTHSVIAEVRMVPNQPLVFADDGQ